MGVVVNGSWGQRESGAMVLSRKIKPFTVTRTGSVCYVDGEGLAQELGMLTVYLVVECLPVLCRGVAVLCQLSASCFKH